MNQALLGPYNEVGVPILLPHPCPHFVDERLREGETFATQLGSRGTRTHMLVYLILWSEYKTTKLHSLPLTVPLSFGADLRKGGPQ